MHILVLPLFDEAVLAFLDGGIRNTVLVADARGAGLSLHDHRILEAEAAQSATVSPSALAALPEDSARS